MVGDQTRAPGGSAARISRLHGGSPGTGFVGVALLLFRRPASLILPVGPAGSGKSTLCEQLRTAMPHASTAVVERDALLATELSAGRSLSSAKRYAHARGSALLQAAAAASLVCVLDSCNASLAGRAHYTSLLRPATLTIVTFRPSRTLGMANADPSCGHACSVPPVASLPAACRSASAALVACAPTLTRHREVLLARTRRRVGHPTFPRSGQPERQAAAVDATLAAMEWPVEELEAKAHGRQLRILTCLVGEHEQSEREAAESIVHALQVMFAATVWLVGVAGIDWEKVVFDAKATFDTECASGCPARTPRCEAPSHSEQEPSQQLLRAPLGVLLRIEPIARTPPTGAPASSGSADDVLLTIVEAARS